MTDFKQVVIPKNVPKRGSVWRHCKGHTAVVCGVCVHTETGEVMVMYSCGRRLYVRPFSMWHETVKPEVRRFTLVRDA